MDELRQTAALWLDANALPNVVGLTGIILGLCVAHLLYGLLHNVVDLLADREHWLLREVRRFCHIVIDLLLYFIAALYALEYMLMKVTQAG